MLTWDVLDAEADEETRQANDICSITSLYEVVKLAYLEPSIEVVDFPKINGCAAYNLMCVSLNSSLLVFKGGGAELLFHLTIKHKIDLIVWLPGGEFVMLADEGGFLHIIHIDSKKDIFKKELNIKKVSSSLLHPLFIKGKSFLLDDGSTLVVMITRYGQIIRISNINTNSLQEGLKAKDTAFLLSLQNQLCFTVNDASQEYSMVYSADCESLKGTNIIKVWLGLDSEVLCWSSASIFSREPTLFSFSQTDQPVKIVSLQNGRNIAVLSPSQSLSIYSALTGVMLWQSLDLTDVAKVLDMQELSSDSHSSQLLLLVDTKCESPNVFLQMINMPEFNCTYEVSVNRGSALLIYGEKADSIGFLEPTYGELNTIINFKLKCIVDGIPEIRLSKLLKQFKFLEAEEFCGMFGLDVDEVFKAKALHLSDLANPWNKSSVNNSSLSKIFEDLVLTLNRINDDEFVIQFCMESTTADLATTKSLLEYAKVRLTETTKTGSGDHMHGLMWKVSEMLYNLSTFQTLHPSENFQAWVSFSRSDMLDNFIHQLTKGHLDTAATLWHRHHYVFIERINEEVVSYILQSIPIGVSYKRLCSWLPKNLLKDLIFLCPSSLEIISQWADKRARELEAVDRGNWPSNGHNFAITIIDALESVAEDFYGGGDIDVQMAVHVAQWKAHSPSSEIFHLRQTALDLKDLKLLSEEFHVKINLDHYRQKDKLIVLAALLDWLVNGEEVRPLMDGFLRLFMLSHKMDCDKSLANYVERTLAQFDHLWWLSEAPWEDKLYAIIDVISDAHIKAECIMQCIRLAPVPWTEGTQRVCKVGKELNTPFSSEIITQERMARLKIVLGRYNLHLINFDDERNAELLLRSISKREGSTVIDDLTVVSSAFQCLEKYDAYYYRLIHLVVTENIYEAKKLLMTLDGLLLKKTCCKFISYVMCELDTPLLRKKCREQQTILLSGVLSLEPFLEQYCQQNPYWEDFFPAVRRVYCLQEKYSLYPSLSDLDDKARCTKFLQDYIHQLLHEAKKSQPSHKPNVTSAQCMASFHPLRGQSFLSSKASDADLRNTKASIAAEGELEKHPIWSNFQRIQFLAILFEVSKQELLVLLASILAKEGHMKDITQIYNMLAEECTNFDAQSLIMNTLEFFCENAELKAGSMSSESIDYKQLVGFLEKMISSALVSCSIDEVWKLSEIGIWCQIGKALYQNCHIQGIYSNSDSNATSDDSLTTWKFSPIFTDQSAPLDQEPIDSFMREICVGYLSFSKQPSGIYSAAASEIASIYESDSIKQAMCNLKSHMNGRNQTLLSLIITLNAASKSLLVSGEYTGISKPELISYISTLLLKIISSEANDLIFAISLLTLLPIKDFLKVINEVIRKLGYEYSKLHLIASVGCDICKLYRLPDVGQQFEILAKNAAWGLKLEPLNISFKACFAQDQMALLAVLRRLVSHKNCTFSLIEQFCIDFDYSTSEAYLMYLRILIQNWGPNCIYDAKLGIDCLKEFPSDLYHKMSSLVAKISDKVLLMKVLKEEFMNINSYFYEMFEIVLCLLMALQQTSNDVISLNKEKCILDFIKEYKRTNPPTNFEIDQWCHSHPEERSLPSASKYRLPFHELITGDKSSVKNIVDGEIGVDSVEMWVQISEYLQIRKDELYFMAAQNSISRTFPLSNQKDLTEWQICCQNSNFLEKVQNVISKIKHPDLATACAFYVVKHLPSGADKVEAAKRCWIRSKNSSAVVQSKENKDISKFKMRYCQLAIKHILHRYNLTESEYVSKIPTPLELIFSLYEHPSLSSPLKFGAKTMPDINGCVSEICDIVSIDKSKAQGSLLSKWLPMTESPQDDLDQTVSNFQLVLDPGASKESQENSESSLHRVIYLLRCYPQEEAVGYLLSQALSTTDSIPISTRLKALRCLLAIADQTTIQEQSGKSLEQLRHLLQGLTYVGRLQNLGHPTSLSLFEKMDKDALVEGLWRSHQLSHEAILLIVDICCDFKIRTASLWGAILTQLKNFIEHRQLEVTVLERVLLQIKTLPHLWLLPSLIQAWQTVIWHPFRTACQPVEGEALRRCIHSANLLGQHCPVSIPIDELLNSCQSLNLPIIALAIAASDQSVFRNLEKLVEQFKPDDIRKNYEDVKAGLYLPKAAEIVVEKMIF